MFDSQNIARYNISVFVYADMERRNVMHDVFKALGDQTRLQIIRILAAGGEVCVCNIVDALNMNQSAVSHHLAKLKQSGLLHSRRDGQWIHYSLNIDAFNSGPIAFLEEIISVAKSRKQKPSGVPCRK